MNSTSQIKNLLSGVMAGCKSAEVFWESVAELQGSPSEAAKPKEKRAPSAYVLFSSRVGNLIHTAQAELPKEQKAKQTVIMQFTSPLWEQSKSGKVWEDHEITEAWLTFVPPEQSKQSLAKAAKTASAAEASQESVPKMQVATKGDLAQTESNADSATESAKKPRKPQSEETKAAAALKRAKTKAAKSAAAGEAAPAAIPEVELPGGWAE